MLADKLNNLQKTSERGTCRLFAISQEMSQGDLKSVLVAIKNQQLSVRSITNVLQSENYSISKDSVNLARRCALGQQKCKCGLFEGETE